MPVDELLATTGEHLPQPYADGLPAGLLDELRAAVEPHTRPTDLGSEDGVRRVTVEVDLERLLLALDRTLRHSLPDTRPLAAELLETVGDGTLTGTLTIDDGHYRRLEVPLAGWVGLVDVDEDVPDLGDSALVLELDDAAGPVQVPARTASLDIASLAAGTLAQREQREQRAAERLPTQLDLSEAERDALLRCFEGAGSQEPVVCPS